MSDSKPLVWGIVGGIITAILWETWGSDWWHSTFGNGSGAAGSGTGGAAGTGSAGAGGTGSGTGGSGSGTGGAGGAGGAGGSGTGGIGDYTALAAAINALAAGVALPNVRTVSRTLSSGTTELVAGEGGKRVCVLAYCVTGSGSVTARFQSTLSAGDLWAIALAAVAGNSGANLATAWPGYLFASQPAEGIRVLLDSAATVAITYWQENA